MARKTGTLTLRVPGPRVDILPGKLAGIGALDLTCLPVKWGEPASTGVSGQNPGPAPGALAGFLAAGQPCWGWRRLQPAALCRGVHAETGGK